MPLESIHKLAFKAAAGGELRRVSRGSSGRCTTGSSRTRRPSSPGRLTRRRSGLDVPKFEECLASGKFDQEIRRDMGEARKVGVTGTPGVHDRPHRGRQHEGEGPRGAQGGQGVRRLQGGGGSAAGGSGEAPGRRAQAAGAEMVEARRRSWPPHARPPPARAALAPDGKLDETTRASLERVLGTAPAGSPAWIAAPAVGSRGRSRWPTSSRVRSRSAGWRVRPVRRTALVFRPGTYLFAAEEEPPAYVRTVAQALDEAGFAAASPHRVPLVLRREEEGRSEVPGVPVRSGADVPGGHRADSVSGGRVPTAARC